MSYTRRSGRSIFVGVRPSADGGGPHFCRFSAATARCSATVARCSATVARCSAIVARCSTIAARCSTIAARRSAAVARCSAAAARCSDAIARCSAKSTGSGVVVGVVSAPKFVNMKIETFVENNSSAVVTVENPVVVGGGWVRLAKIMAFDSARSEFFVVKRKKYR